MNKYTKLVILFIFLLQCSCSTKIQVSKHPQKILETPCPTRTPEFKSDTPLNTSMPIHTKSPMRVYTYPGDGGTDNPSAASLLIKRKADLIFTDKYKEKNNVIYGRFKIVLPQFEDNRYPGINNINNFFIDKLSELKKTRFEFYDYCKDDQSKNYYVCYEPRYLFNDSKYLSVFSIHDGNTGGIRTWQRPEAVNFDITTGKKLTLDDIFKINRKSYMSKIEHIIKEYYKSNMYDETFLHDHRIINELKQENFFLSDKAITIFYARGSIRVYGCGNIFFEIPFDLLF